MGILIGRIIWANGKLNPSCPSQLSCSSQGIESGYLLPEGDCCTDNAEYTFYPSTSPSTRTDAIYGVSVYSEGVNYFVDVQGGTETAATTMTSAIMKAKLDKVVTACACTDCTSGTPTVNVTPVYAGVYPASTSGGSCYTVVRVGTAAGVAEQVILDYNEVANSTIKITAVNTTTGEVTYAFKASSLPLPVRAGDVIAAAAAAVCN
jgi:hypothetical protein